MKIIDGGIKRNPEEASKFKKDLEDKYGKENVIAIYRECGTYLIIAFYREKEKKEIEER